MPPLHIVTLQKYPATGKRIQTYTFPVNAEQVDIRQGRDTVDVAMLRERTVARPGNATPLEFELNDLLIPDPNRLPPNWGMLNVPQSAMANPFVVARMLREWQTSAGDKTHVTPLRLTIADSSGMMYWVTMTKCDISIKAGEVGHLYLSAGFKEIMDLPRLAASASKRVNPKPTASSTKSKAGENLITILRRQYGQAVPPALLTQVYNLNKTAIGPDRTRRLPAGTTIKFPATPAK